MSRVGVITGLAREADCFRAVLNQDRLLVRCAGGNSERAAETARILVSKGCRGLVSFGIAGGLQPGLDPGTLVIASSVVGPDNSRIQSDRAWQLRLMAVVERELVVVGSDILGCDQPVLLSTEKRRLYKQTGAATVDMESHAVAQVAAERGVSFLAIRAVADPVGRDIPNWVPDLVGDDGRPRARAVIAGIVRHPLQVPVLMSLGADSEKAIASLRRVALTAGPFLQFDT